MSQGEVQEFLEMRGSNGRWYSAKTISNQMRRKVGSITTNLKKLRKSGLVQSKFVTRKIPGVVNLIHFYVYKYLPHGGDLT